MLWPAELFCNPVTLTNFAEIGMHETRVGSLLALFYFYQINWVKSIAMTLS